MQAPTSASTDRYRLDVIYDANHAPRVSVHDRHRQCRLLGWEGQIARRMIESGALPADFCRNGCHGCDKALVRRLILQAAVAEMRAATACN